MVKNVFFGDYKLCKWKNQCFQKLFQLLRKWLWWVSSDKRIAVFVCTWCVVVHVANHTPINLNKSLRESNLNHHAEGRVRALLYNTVGNIFGHQTLFVTYTVCLLRTFTHLHIRQIACIRGFGIRFGCGVCIFDDKLFTSNALVAFKVQRGRFVFAHVEIIIIFYT